MGFKPLYAINVQVFSLQRIITNKIRMYCILKIPPNSLTFTYFLGRTRSTLSGKQKRQLQEKLEYIQEVVKAKKVVCMSDSEVVPSPNNWRVFNCFVSLLTEKALWRVSTPECQRSWHGLMKKPENPDKHGTRDNIVLPSCAPAARTYTNHSKTWELSPCL